MQRSILRILQGQTTHDGDGVKISRIAARGNLSLLDPFLMLDEFGSDEAADYIGGFPAHPHRGFETVTYMLEGKMRHTDHMGNVGLLQTGGVQWMTAGKGIIHAEMPEQTQGLMRGFQLWVNLPAKSKMQPARYQEFDPDHIPTVSLSSGKQIKIIAGEFNGVHGPVTNIATDASYFDIALAAGEQLELNTAPQYTALIYVYEGSVDIAGKPLSSTQLAQLTEGESVTIKASAESRLLFLSARPIGEPIVNYGPFVMNTHEEIEQAIRDYRNGTLTD